MFITRIHMKILLVNKFFWQKGGSERVFFAEAELLKAGGQELAFFSMKDQRNLGSADAGYFVGHADYEAPAALSRKINQSLNILYSFEARRKMRRLLREHSPDIVHLHNIHHQLSPSILDAVKECRIPTVMTLHDFKLVCPVYSLLSNGSLCQRCAGGRYYWCLLKRCNRKSFAKSLVNVLEMYLHHNVLNMYDHIHAFISPSMFVKQKIREMGFDRELLLLPNFVNAAEFKPRYSWEERSILYFGRISAEKGILTLMRAVRDLDVTLKIIGDGPLKTLLESGVGRGGRTNIRFCGYKTGDDLKREIRDAMFTVLPSECYENNPRSVIEAFALGKPVIGSRIGGIPELVRDGETGLTFTPGDGDDLRDKIRYLLAGPGLIAEMGRRAREYVERELTPEKHYTKLMEIYDLASGIKNRGNRL
jgi:glycosyltransferase involved in cell wall biosynthesis